ncbi:MAG: hypothetical protein GY778_01950 [bacterium]|nr:hypothetical protein [bacterium]
MNDQRSLPETVRRWQSSILVLILLGAIHASLARGNAAPPSKAPKIELTQVPPTGSDEDLRGRVANVDSAAHRVAICIFVDAWWTKPTFEAPTVPIQADGSWQADITTGESDAMASKIAAFVIPVGAAPPRVAGEAELPTALVQLALASVVVERKPLREQSTYRRFVQFSGYRWSVKSRDFPVGPGPNRFSDRKEDVWVDDRGLHLTIRKRNEHWYCTEVILQESFGYGTYVFYTMGSPDSLDLNVVAGMFTWETEAPAPHIELDFEYARWGDSEDPTNAQFVVQPFQTPGNLVRYRVEPERVDRGLTHVLVWSKDKAEFTTARGHHRPDRIPASAIISALIYTGPGVPEPGNENVRVNLWLDRGAPPRDGRPAEFLVTRFAYVRPQ